jgi:hypothetical protein
MELEAHMNHDELALRRETEPAQPNGFDKRWTEFLAGSRDGVWTDADRRLARLFYDMGQFSAMSEHLDLVSRALKVTP